MKEIFFEKNEKMYFWQKPEGVIPHDGNFDSKKGAHILASLCEGEWFSYLLSVPGKVSYKLDKNGKKFRKTFSLLYLLKKPRAKKN